jgi:hypothetical protein
MTQTTIDIQAICKQKPQSVYASKKTCADCPFYKAHNDGTKNGWCQLFNHFAREYHQQTQDCINTIADEQAIAQEELDEYIEQQAQELAPEFEIDSVSEESGELYRIWRSYEFVGSFYQDLDGKWVAQPARGDFRPRCNTAEQAQMVIIAIFDNPDLQVA